MTLSGIFAAGFSGEIDGGGFLLRRVAPCFIPRFGRGNILAEEIDGALFKGATFGQLADLENRPYLIVGATDLATGAGI